MNRPPFRDLGPDVMRAIEEGAQAAMMLFSRPSVGHNTPAVQTISSHGGFTVEFVLAALYDRHSSQLRAHVREEAKLDAMCRDFSVSPENRILPVPSLTSAPTPPPGSDSAEGWSINLTPELLRVLSNAGRIAATLKQRASVRDLIRGLQEDGPATAGLAVEWGVSFKET